ncbi:MAG: glycerol-3-phosphate acyltransferase [Candidatus Nanopelagicales bacterium]|nr:glycerol-3-phosphate acyltransferase [Candidatus Nanopelagicales bacterium]MDZ4250478.1 glycerol-3-phosphate acyltransferase [Candidatus Nanopelagicales bacterium]
MNTSGPWIYALAFLIGYALGSISPAALIARAKGVSLRETGSGNPGATNVGRALGVRTGVLVGVLDILKGFIPAIAFAQIGPVAAEVAGLAAVLGHITSPFLRGRGGKGTATTLGAILGAQPLWAIPVLIGFGVGFGVTRRVGIGSIIAALVLLVCAVLTGDWDSRTFGVLLALLVVVRHYKNIVAAWRDWRSRT